MILSTIISEQVYNLFFKIDSIFGLILTIFISYHALFIIIGLFATKKFKKAKVKHKYGILIAARNEEKVIGNLLDSINNQDYPKDLLTVFVVADNCDDNTAEVAKKHGAIVYKRIDHQNKTKGFALQYLLDRIEEDYQRSSFEGFFVFDADNLLKKNYISKMNDAFDEGFKIVTSYRNTKNFDDNWISAMYAFHWLRSIRFNHRARSVLHLATNIQGTGFLFKSNIVKDGWKYTSLTEDRAFTVDAVAQGYQITYQDEAEFYDEQPVDLKIAMRQRIRWAKGHLLAFCQTAPYLFTNIFFGKLFVKTKWEKMEKPKGFWLNLVESIRHRFASFDTLCQLTPLMVVHLIRWIIIYLIITSLYRYGLGINEINIITGSSWLASIINKIIYIPLTCHPGWTALFLSLLLELISRIIYRLGVDLVNILTAIYLFIVERKRIKRISFSKKIFYAIMWPVFDIMGRYATYIAVFKKVEWKQIPHNSKITINDIK